MTDETPPDNDIITRVISFPILPPAGPEKAQKEPEKRYIEIEATAYCLRGTMFNGEYVHKGAISVDPKVIPLGTRGYIEGIGDVVASDTGGAVKGNIVDIWMPSYEEAMNWGRRKVKLWITE
jgi:3D (Asp-Asp-Asp) domain-containing protein